MASRSSVISISFAPITVRRVGDLAWRAPLFLAQRPETPGGSRELDP
ncbi:hypothetical protein [Nocardia higoensis]|nr:hypothetical protein [Nocardia higoensis]